MQLHLPGLTLRAVSSRGKPTCKSFRNQAEPAMPGKITYISQ
jgi:hypothetical protein